MNTHVFYLWLTFHLDGFHIRFTSVSASVASTRLILGLYWLIAIYNDNIIIVRFRHLLIFYLPIFLHPDGYL